MKKCFALPALSLFISLQISAQTYQRSYWGFNGEGAKIIQDNSGYLLMGNFYDTIPYDEVSVAKVDQYGKLSWFKVYSQPNGTLEGWNIMKMGNGYLMLSVANKTATQHAQQAILSRLDDSGNILWSKEYGGGSADGLSDFWLTSDGGLIMVGGTTSYGRGQTDIYIVKTDTLGNVMWTKTFGTWASESAYLVRETSNGDFIVVGEKDDIYNMQNNTIILLRYSSTGNLLLHKEYSFHFSFYTGITYKCANISKSGDILVSGEILNHPLVFQPYMLRADSNLNLKFFKKLIPDALCAEACSIAPTDDDGCVLAFEPEGFATNEVSQLGGLKLDASGNLQWAKIYNQHTAGDFRSVITSLDRGFAFTGYDYGNNFKNTILIKSDSLGNVNSCPADTVIGFTLQDTILSIDTLGTESSGCSFTNTIVNVSGRHYFDTLNCGDDVPKFTGENYELDIPNVFTPNGDGVNDFFMAKGENISQINLTIFNRWGDHICTLRNPNDFWDGRSSNGESCSNGTYFYVASAIDTSGRKIQKKGFFQLLR